VTTDQDGNFKVGSYFSVDQVRGTVSISAPISLTNVDGLSFKRGQTLVQVFSVDGTMANQSNNSVPTEGAIVSYVDSRLGLNKNNTTLGITPIGSGFLDLGGARGMAANLNMNSYTINNVHSPSATTDAANKAYTDTKLSRLGTNDTIGASAGTLSGPIKTNEITPNIDNTYWLGTSSYRWSNISTVNLSVDGTFNLTSTVDSTNTTSGALKVAGGVGIGKSLYADKVFDNNVRVISTVSTGTGVYGGGSGPSITISIGQDVASSASPTFAGITVPSITKSGTNGTGDIGATGNRFGTVWATTFSGTSNQAQYADLAEKYMPDREYEPGTVLVFGGDAEVTMAKSYMDTRIAGVVSTHPAYMMNSALEGGVYVALTGRVPCKVTGKIRKGDMLVAAGALGVATASNNPKMGSVIGKALENYDSHDIGVIEVVVGRI